MSPQDAGRREGTDEPAGARLPTPLADVLELLEGESATSRTFLGGVALGALVGAALAGASVMRHRAPGSRRRKTTRSGLWRLAGRADD